MIRSSVSDENPTPAHGPDEELLRRFQAGDPGALRTIAGWARQVVSFKRFHVPFDDRDDLVQESIAGLWRAVSREGFALRRGLRPLVTTIASARCIERLRRFRPIEAADVDPPDRGPGPYETLQHLDEREQLRMSIRRLSGACREIIQLHFFEEVSYAEIAARQDRAESTMRFRMFECMKRLRRMVTARLER